MDENQLQVRPWLDMYTKPRKTIRAIVEYNPRYRFLMLCFLYGLSTVFQLAQNFSFTDVMSLSQIIAVSVIVSLFIGIIGMSISSALLYITGKWIGGIGTFIQVRAAVSWSNVTALFNVILWAALIGMFKEQVFCANFIDAPFVGYQLALVTGIVFLQLVLSVWSFILLLHSVGEVHGFSVWKSLLAVVISFAIVVLALWLLGMLLWGGRGT